MYGIMKVKVAVTYNDSFIIDYSINTQRYFQLMTSELNLMKLSRDTEN